MKLYSYYLSTSAWRVRIVLAHKALRYETAPVNLAPNAEEQTSEAFRGVNPLQQVPTLEWTTATSVVRLSQSVAIIEYLEETHPERPLLPADPWARAHVREAVQIVNSGIQPLQNSGTITALRKLGTEDQVLSFARSAIARGFEALESHAGARGGRFSVGDEPTLADVFLIPQLARARRLGMDFTPYPRLVAIESRASELEAFAAAHADRQPDNPQLAR